MVTKLSKAERSKVDKKVKLEVNWQHVKESSPAFGRLMTLLLREKREEREGAVILWFPEI